MYIPISDPELSQMHDVFMACFSTQKKASFPSPSHDGPFSEVADMFQRKQFAEVKMLLGDAYFSNHESEKIRNATGFQLIREMDFLTFINSAESLQKHYS